MEQLQRCVVNSGRALAPMPQCSHTQRHRPLTLQQWPLDARHHRRSHQPRANQCSGSYALAYSSSTSRRQALSSCSRVSTAALRRQGAQGRRSAPLRSHPLPQAALEAEEAMTDSSELGGLDGLHLQHDATVHLVSEKDGEYMVEGSMEAAASADTAFGLLCDYERVASVFTNVLQSQTFRTVGDDTRLQQECRWEFLMFSGKFPLELTVSEQPAERRVVFNLAESPFMRSFQGTWQVHEHASGGCRILHTMAVKPVLSAPRPFASYTRRVFERQVATIMEDLGRALAAEEADGAHQEA